MNYLIIKRAMDIIFSMIFIALFTPIFILTGISIMISDRTFRILYVSIRIGKDAKAFKIYKFRSMNINCSANEIFAKHRNDPRITKIGKFIRKYSIDELPQLFNVLKGEMSLIGNRPLPAMEASVLYRYYPQRFDAPAGMTGLWQVCRKESDTVNSRIALDLIYARSISWDLDAAILIMTPIRMFNNY